MWVASVGLVALAFWVVGLGTGMRGWILAENDRGIVAHAQAFGEMAYVWWTPATVITLIAAVMGVGTTIVRHLADGPVEMGGEEESVGAPREAVPPLGTGDDNAR